MNVLANKIKNYISHKNSILKINITLYTTYLHIEIIQPTKKIILNISDEFSWEEIQTSLDVHLECELSRTCPRCSITDQEKVFRVSCPNCASYWCNTCYWKMLRQFYDVDILCPHCNYNINTHTCFMELGEWEKKNFYNT